MNVHPIVYFYLVCAILLVSIGLFILPTMVAKEKERQNKLKSEKDHAEAS
jgi:hypothetical protein